MVYKVLPFNASISKDQGADVAASQLEALIGQMTQQGFEYVSLESIPTFVAGTSGCFGIGATPATTSNYPVVIFRK